MNRIDTQKIRVFNGEIFESRGMGNINLNFGELNLNIRDACVVDDLRYDFIIGMSHIKSLRLENTSNDVKIIMNGHTLNVTFKPNTCFSVSNMIVPANSVIFAPVRMKAKFPPGQLYFEGRRHLPAKMSKISIIDSITRSDNPLIKIVNLGDTDVEINQNFAIAELKPASDSSINALHVVKDSELEQSRHLKFLSQRLEKFAAIKNPLVNFDDNLDTHERNTIQNCLNKNYQCFAFHKFDIGCIKGFRYKVDLKPDAKNWFQPQRRIAPAKRKEVRNQLDLELENGLISRCSSKYNHALVLVRKGDGGLRICSDLRQMNKNIEMERFPLPNIESLFDRLGEELKAGDGKPYIASFDIQSAYRALEIHPKDKNKLAFSFESDMYTHERMPFGLSDAPSTFSYVMRIILNGLPGVFNYLDDLIVVQRGLHNFVKTLDNLFKRLLEFGILLKPSKCMIGLKEIPFLGHILTTSGVKIQPEKVKAIRELRQPGSKDELRSVLGMFNYHHNSVADLYTILQPLFEMLKISKTFRWTKDCQKSFQQAKEAIANATEKKHRDLELPLVLSTDASNVGCGAVLYQKRGEELEPLQYFSKNFSDSEQRLPIRTRELLSIAFAIKNFETILVGEHFTVLTDHKSLMYLNNTAIDALSIRSRNMLWYLSHFDFSMTHVNGTDKRNKISDCLSRAVAFKKLDISEADVFETGDEFRDITNIDVIDSALTPEIETFLSSLFDLEELKKAQLMDSKIKNYITKSSRTKTNDIILDDRGRVMLPEKLADDLIQYVHVKKAHLSIDKLTSYLSPYFALPNLSKRCEVNVKSCLDCLASKEWPMIKGDVQDKQHVVTGPFVKVFCDLIDLGSHSKTGMRYGLTYLDALTRHLDCVPIPDKKQETVTNGLIQLIMRWGIPESIITDNGAEFVNLANDLLREVFGIYVSRISPYNPRGNLVERAHKEMKKLFVLHKVDLENWDSWLPIILFSYNTAIHGALPNMSPFEALFLRKSKDVLSCGRVEKLNKKWLTKFPALAPFEELVKNSITQFKLKNNQLSNPKILTSGQQVLVYSKLKPGECSKLHRYWTGPYTVIEKTNPSVYRLRHNITSQRLLRHVRYIRLFNPVKKDDERPLSTVNEEPERLSNSNEKAPQVEEEEPPPLPAKQTRLGRPIIRPKRFQE